LYTLDSKEIAMSRRYGSFAFVLLAVFVLASVAIGPRPGRAYSVGYYLYHLWFCKNYFYNSTLYLSNISGTTANVVITLKGVGGAGKDGIYSEVRIIAANDLVSVYALSLGIPDGLYNVIVSSDQPLQSVIWSRGPDSFFEPGTTEVTTTHVFVPLLKDSLNTGVTLFSPIATANVTATFQNSDDTLAYSQNYVTGVTLFSPIATANVTATFRNRDGTLAHSQNYVVAASRAITIYAPDIDALPSGFNGSLYITADQPLAGLLQQVRSAPWYETEAYPDQSAANQAFLPRAFKSVDEGNGPRTTALFLANPNATTATVVTLQFLNAAGSVIHSPVYNVPSLGSVYVDLADVAQLTDGRYSVVMAADLPAVFSSLTYHLSAPLYPDGNYETAVYSTTLRLPYIARTDSGHTVLSLQNVGATAATAVISYFNTSGSLVYSQTVTNLIPGQARRIDHSQLAGLPLDYVGHAVINGSDLMSAVVDEYLIPLCAPPTNTRIIQTPPGLIYTYTPITFTATASGTLPFSHTWTIDSTPLTVTTDVFSDIFTVAGHFTLGVTVTNTCGADHADLAMNVQPSDHALFLPLISR
jgi:hypothetical protein